MDNLTVFEYFEKTYQAICNDDVDTIQKIIPEHLRPSRSFPKKYSDICQENMPIFIFAMLVNSINTVNYLLNCGIDINNVFDAILNFFIFLIQEIHHFITALLLNRLK